MASEGWGFASLKSRGVANSIDPLRKMSRHGTWPHLTCHPYVLLSFDDRQAPHKSGRSRASALPTISAGPRALPFAGLKRSCAR
jgi:hypothetical protein